MRSLDGLTKVSLSYLTGSNIRIILWLIICACHDGCIDYNDIAFLRRDAAYKRYVDNIFQVSVSTNRQLYNEMTKEDKKMCEALKDLLKEDFAAAEARGEARGKVIGEAQGEIKGMIKLYHEEMGLDSQEIIIRIMERFSLDEKTARNFVESTLGLQPV